MAQLGDFTEVKAGQTCSAYENDKMIGIVHIPLELEAILTEPQFKRGTAWYVLTTGTLSHEELSGGLFELQFLNKVGVFFCGRYDPYTKKFSKIWVKYDELVFRGIPDMSFTELYDVAILDLVGVLKFLSSKLKLNKAMQEKVNKILERCSL
jgi:hypothetical protein